jgi:hypothetical protein
MSGQVQGFKKFFGQDLAGMWQRPLGWQHDDSSVSCALGDRQAADPPLYAVT